MYFNFYLFFPARILHCFTAKTRIAIPPVTLLVHTKVFWPGSFRHIKYMTNPMIQMVMLAIQRAKILFMSPFAVLNPLKIGQIISMSCLFHILFVLGAKFTKASTKPSKLQLQMLLLRFNL